MHNEFDFTNYRRVIGVPYDLHEKAVKKTGLLKLLIFNPLTSFENMIMMKTRDHSRFFVQDGHDTKYSSKLKSSFFTISCHCQTYQNYQQSQ